MAAKKIGLVVALDGEKEFKAAIKEMKSEVKLYKTELKNLDTAYKDNRNTLEALTKKQEALAKEQEAYKKQLDAAKTGLENAKTEYKKQADAVDDLRKKLEEATKKQDEIAESAGKASKEYEDQTKEVDKLRNALSQQTAQMSTAQARVNNWTGEVSKSERALEACNKDIDANKKYLDEASSSADGCASSIDKYGNEISGAADDVNELNISLGDMIKNKLVDMAVDALSNLASKAVEAAKYIVDVGSSFEAQMSKVGAISGSSATELQQLTDKAAEMGRTTSFSASEAGAAMEYMAMAGWKTSDMLSGVEGVMNLAAASGADLATTSDIVTDALTAFGASASDAGRLADIMAAASTNANTNVELMGETFKYVAPLAGSMGYSMEDVAEAVGLMANAGIKGSTAGTSLRSVITRLATDAGASANKLGALGVLTQELGVEFYNTDGSARGLNEVLTDARQVWAYLTEEEKVNAANTIAGKNAMSGFLALMNAGEEDVNKLSTAIQNCNGTASAMADTMLDNLQGKVTIFNSALEGLGIALYGYFSGPLQNAVSLATDFINGITNILTPQKTELSSFIESVEKANEQAAKTLKTAQDTLKSGATEAAEIGVYGEVLKEILEQCSEFNQVTLENGETAIIDSTGNIVQQGTDPLSESLENLQTEMDSFGSTGLSGETVTGDIDTLINRLLGLDSQTEKTDTAISNVGKSGISEISGIDEAKKDLGEVSDEAVTASTNVDAIDDTSLSIDASNITGPVKEVSTTSEAAHEDLEKVDDVNYDRLDVNNLTNPMAVDVVEAAGSAKTAVENLDDAQIGSLDVTKPEGSLSEVVTKTEETKTAEEDISNAQIGNLDTSAPTGDLTGLATTAGDTGNAISDVGKTGIATSEIERTAGDAKNYIGYVKQEAVTVEEKLKNFATEGISVTGVRTGKEAIIQVLHEADGDIETFKTTISETGDVEIPTEKLNGAVSLVVTAFDPIGGAVKQVKGDIANIGTSFNTADLTTSFSQVEDSVRKVVVVTDEFTKTRITNVVSTLSKYVPELADGWNEVTGELSISVEELNKWIDGAQRLALQEAMTKARSEAYTAEANAIINAAKAHSAYVKAAEDEAAQTGILEQMFEKYIGSIEDGNYTFDQMISLLDQYINAARIGTDITQEEVEAFYNASGSQAEYAAAVDRAAEAEAEANKIREDAHDTTQLTESALEELSGAYEDNAQASTQAADGTGAATKSLQDYIDEADEAEEAAEDLTKAQKQAIKAFSELYETTGKSLEDLKSSLNMTDAEFADWCADRVKEAEEIQKAYTDMTDSIKKSMHDYVTAIDTSGEEGSSAIDNMISSFTEKAKNLKQWTENMKELGKLAGNGFSQALYDQLAEEGPEKGGEAVQAIVDALHGDTEKFEEVSKAYEDALQIEADAETLAAYTQAGKDYAQAVADGYAGSQEEYESAVKASVDAGATAGMDETAANREVGEAAAEETAAGIEATKAEVETATSEMLQAARKTAEQIATDFYVTGQLIPQKLKAGINVQKSYAIDAAKSLADKTYEEIKNTLDKYTEAGKTAVVNYGNGISGNISVATNASSSMATRAVSKVTEKQSSYRTAGQQAATAYAGGISDNAGTSAENASSMASTAAGQAAKVANFRNAGQQVANAFALGINDNADTSAANASTMATTAAGQAAKVTNFRSAGQQVAYGFALGISDNASTASANADSMARSAAGAATLVSNFRSAGQQVAYGFSLGIKDNSSYAYNAAYQMALDAYNAAQTAIDSHSPSRKFMELGRYSDEGLALGFEKNQDMVVDAARASAVAAVQAAESELSGHEYFADLTSQLSYTGALQMDRLSKARVDTGDTASAIRELRQGMRALSELAEAMSNPTKPNVTVIIGNQEFKGYIVKTASEGFSSEQRNILRGRGMA